MMNEISINGTYGLYSIHLEWMSAYLELQKLIFPESE